MANIVNSLALIIRVAPTRVQVLEGKCAGVPMVHQDQSQGTHSNCIFKFPVFSLSNWKFSLCQFTLFVSITYTKLTWQTDLSSFWKKMDF